ncbi:hypothetical protein VTL71DRAFT_3005 [Oculimacula yallundae]|uniref:Uncharacterized protein n=1 Tax=Oculimacula yallundae TaxID=86028 RepID=A0ABR4C5X5_9HELO
MSGPDPQSAYIGLSFICDRALPCPFHYFTLYDRAVIYGRGMDLERCLWYDTGNTPDHLPTESELHGFVDYASTLRTVPQNRAATARSAVSGLLLSSSGSRLSRHGPIVGRKEALFEITGSKITGYQYVASLVAT